MSRHNVTILLIILMGISTKIVAKINEVKDRAYENTATSKLALKVIPYRLKVDNIKTDSIIVYSNYLTVREKQNKTSSLISNKPSIILLRQRDESISQKRFRKSVQQVDIETSSVTSLPIHLDPVPHNPQTTRHTLTVNTLPIKIANAYHLVAPQINQYQQLPIPETINSALQKYRNNRNHAKPLMLTETKPLLTNLIPPNVEPLLFKPNHKLDSSLNIQNLDVFPPNLLTEITQFSNFDKVQPDNTFKLNQETLLPSEIPKEKIQHSKNYEFNSYKSKESLYPQSLYTQILKSTLDTPPESSKPLQKYLSPLYVSLQPPHQTNSITEDPIRKLPENQGFKNNKFDQIPLPYLKINSKVMEIPDKVIKSSIQIPQHTYPGIFFKNLQVSKVNFNPLLRHHQEQYFQTDFNDSNQQRDLLNSSRNNKDLNLQGESVSNIGYSRKPFVVADKSQSYIQSSGLQESNDEFKIIVLKSLSTETPKIYVEDQNLSFSNIDGKLSLIDSNIPLLSTQQSEHMYEKNVDSEKSVIPGNSYTKSGIVEEFPETSKDIPTFSTLTELLNPPNTQYDLFNPEDSKELRYYIKNTTDINNNPHLNIPIYHDLKPPSFSNVPFINDTLYKEIAKPDVAELNRNRQTNSFNKPFGIEAYMTLSELLPPILEPLFTKIDKNRIQLGNDGQMLINQFIRGRTLDDKLVEDTEEPLNDKPLDWYKNLDKLSVPPVPAELLEPETPEGTTLPPPPLPPTPPPPPPIPKPSTLTKPTLTSSNKDPLVLPIPSIPEDPPQKITKPLSRPTPPPPPPLNTHRPAVFAPIVHPGNHETFQIETNEDDERLHDETLSLEEIVNSSPDSEQIIKQGPTTFTKNVIKFSNGELLGSSYGYLSPDNVPVKVISYKLKESSF